MSDTAVAVDFYHVLDVHGNFTTEITFYSVEVFDFVTQLCNVFLSQILSADRGINAGLSEDVCSALTTDTVNVGKGDVNALVVGNINTSYTSPSYSPLRLV